MNEQRAAGADRAASGQGAGPPVRVWDLPVRVFHWALVASFAAAYLLSESERQRQLHVMFGYTVLGLVAFRLVWGFIGTRWARFRSFLFGPRAALGYLRDLLRGAPAHYVGHNPAGSWAVYAILVLAAATGITGWCTLNEYGGDALEELHELLANSWLVVVIAHVAGVVAGSFVHRENLARAMVTGYKRGANGPAGAGGGASASVLVGTLLAAAVLAFWIGSQLTGGLALGARAERGEAAGLARGDADDDD